MAARLADLAAATALAGGTRTFDEAFAEHRLTQEERTALVWHLAEYRARKTVEALLYGVDLGFDPRDVLRGLI